MGARQRAQTGPQHFIHCFGGIYPFIQSLLRLTGHRHGHENYKLLATWYCYLSAYQQAPTHTTPTPRAQRFVRRAWRVLARSGAAWSACCAAACLLRGGAGPLGAGPRNKHNTQQADTDERELRDEWHFSAPCAAPAPSAHPHPRSCGCALARARGRRGRSPPWRGESGERGERRPSLPVSLVSCHVRVLQGRTKHTFTAPHSAVRLGFRVSTALQLPGRNVTASVEA